jgi:hypothetical protein
MNGNLGFWIGIVLVAVFAALLMCLVCRNEEDEIRLWAGEHGFVVLSCELTAFDNGPFYIRAKYQRIYRADLEDGEGNVRTAYFRLGWGLEHAWKD